MWSTVRVRHNVSRASRNQKICAYRCLQSRTCIQLPAKQDLYPVACKAGLDEEMVPDVHGLTEVGRHLEHSPQDTAACIFQDPGHGANLTTLP